MTFKGEFSSSHYCPWLLFLLCILTVHQPTHWAYIQILLHNRERDTPKKRARTNTHANIKRLSNSGNFSAAEYFHLSTESWSQIIGGAESIRAINSKYKFSEIALCVS